jgi:DNA-binding transcriptional regulator GbsR (MarR family)
LAPLPASPPPDPPETPSPDTDPVAAVKTGFIQDYGQGYQVFGLPKLMGQIVGLLLYHDAPLSLDDITTELQVSKGPVSQIMRRLRDHDLVRRVWVPGSRRDYYEAAPDIFGQAFRNHADLQNRNLLLARKYTELIRNTDADLPASFAARMQEMDRFYTLMNTHLDAFLAEWQATRDGGPGAPTANGEDER